MFTLPLRSYQQTLRGKGSENNRRKRKRVGTETTQEQGWFGGPDIKARTSSLRSNSPLQHASSGPVLTPNDIYQYSVAGQSVEDQRPSPPFPHAAFGGEDGPARFAYRLQQQLAPAHASAQAEEDPSDRKTLHQQHLAVMTAILHRALLEEDFARASRALGLILRDETGGIQNDIRSEGNWGIGAEILLRQDAHQYSVHHKQGNKRPVEQRIGAEAASRPCFTREGFENAKKYYERLIIQYPLRKQAPAIVNALDFYSAMFGLWIYVSHWESKTKSLNLMSVKHNSADCGGSLCDGITVPLESTSAVHQLIREELSEARKIADRMDSVMGSLPYKEYFELTELRSMVQIWRHDLEEMLPHLDSTTSD